MNLDLDEMVIAYGEKLLRYATSILYNHQDAEDVVQDTFLSAYQSKQTFDGEHLSAWLYKITYNKCMNLIKRRRFMFLSDVPENTVSPAAETDPESSRVLDMLGHLSPKDRALFYARVIEGYSYEEISARMGIGADALRKRYQRAKAKLARALGEENPNLNKPNLTHREEQTYEKQRF